MRYGDVSPSHRERFLAGAFPDLSDVRLDVQHDRRRILTRTGAGLEMTDGPSALEFAAELPGTREADDALELVRRKVLRGASVEFIATSERAESGVRVIEGAELVAVSIVDNPAYRDSKIEARRYGGGLSGSYNYGRLHVTSASGKTRKTRLQKGALDYALDDADREISLNMGSSLDSTLGTRSSGTLAVRKTADGLAVSVARLPETQAAADLVGLQEAGIALHVRPRYQLDGVPNAYKDVPEPGNPGVLVREVSNALLLGFDLTIRGKGNGYDAIALTSPRRRRFYL